MKFFDLLSIQHAVLLIFGGIATVLVIVLAYYSDRFVVGTRRGASADILQFPEGIAKGDSLFPLVLFLLIIGLAVWAVIYVLMASAPDIKI